MSLQGLGVCKDSAGNELGPGTLATDESLETHGCPSYQISQVISNLTTNAKEELLTKCRKHCDQSAPKTGSVITDTTGLEVRPTA